MPSETELGQCQIEGEQEAEMLPGATGTRHQWGGKGRGGETSSITSLK